MHFFSCSPTSAAAMFLTLGLHGFGVLASPTSLGEKNIFRRQDAPEHCIDSTVDAENTKGNLFCFDDSGNDLTCDECLGLNGNEPAKSENGVRCHISTGDDGNLGQLTACPGDPPPEENPDGTPGSDVSTGILDAYCSAAGAGGLFGWTTFAACYSYTFAKAQGNPVDEAMAGVKCRLISDSDGTWMLIIRPSDLQHRLCRPLCLH